MRKKRKVRIVLTVFVLTVLFMGLTGQALKAKQAKPFAGETLNVVIIAEVYAEGIRKFLPEFTAKTGIKVNLLFPSVFEAYQQQMLEVTTMGAGYDVLLIAPTWLASFAPYLEELGPLAEKHNVKFDLDDIVPILREFYTKYKRVWCAVPFDADLHILLYRKSAFENSEFKAKFYSKYGYELKTPDTWQQYRDVAEFFTGWDWDDDGEIEYGTIESWKRNPYAYYWWLNRFASNGGVYFDENLNPLINTPNGIKALEQMLDVKPFTVLGVEDFGYPESRTAWVKGDAAMDIIYTDVPKAAEDPEESKIVGDTGYALTPGWVNDGKLIRHVSMPPTWIMAIPRWSEHKGAAITFLSFYYESDKSIEIAVDPATAVDPCRFSQFQSPKFRNSWPTAGYYLDTVKTAIETGFPELQVPGAWEYIDAADYEISQALAGVKTPKEALDAAAKKWNDISEDLGREKQRILWLIQYDAMKKMGIAFNPLED